MTEEEKRKRGIAATQRWRKNHPEEARAMYRKQNRKYYQEHKEECRAATKKWRDKNPEKAKELAKKYFQKYKKEHPKEYLERQKKYNRIFWERHKDDPNFIEKRREQGRNYSRKHRKELADKYQQWKKEHPIKYARYYAKFRKRHLERIANEPGYQEKIRAKGREKYYKYKQDPQWRKKQSKRVSDHIKDLKENHPYLWRKHLRKRKEYRDNNKELLKWERQYYAYRKTNPERAERAYAEMIRLRNAKKILKRTKKPME